MDVGLPHPSKSSTLMIYSDFCACMILALKGLINIFPYHKPSYFLNFSVNCGLQDPKRGNWWLQVGSNVVGYWPSSIFSYLADSASSIMWGGEVYSPNPVQTSTQMGSGHFPEEGFGKASYIRNIQVVGSSNILKSPDNMDLLSSQQGCYNVQNGTNRNWGTYIYYGGPGKNPNCDGKN
jgi:hypothetical protein